MHIGLHIGMKRKSPWLPNTLTPDANMEISGVTNWPVFGAGASRAKGTDNPVTGNQYLRLTGGAFAYTARTSTLTPGSRYLISMWIRGDGTNVPEIWDLTSGNIQTAHATAAWKVYNVDHTAVGTGFAVILPTGGYVDIDDVTVRPRRA